MFYGQWGDYVPVAARREKAKRELARLRKAGQPASPVEIEGRTIAKTFWGKAWCENLESYQDYENRLPRGRSYVRNGSVIDLQIASSSVKAMVMGGEMYKIAVKIAPLPPARWRALCKECAGGIDSMIELLRGRFSDNVMERLCRREDGLFPKPSEIELSCSCPDWSDMCKHVAAALYGVGARLDKQPDLLFRLRGVDEKALVGGVRSLPTLTSGAPKRAVSKETDLSALFGLDIAPAAAAPAPRGKAIRAARVEPMPATEVVDLSSGPIRPTRKAKAPTKAGAKTAPKSKPPAKQARGSKSSGIVGESALRRRKEEESGPPPRKAGAGVSNKSAAATKRGAVAIGAASTRSARRRPT